MVHGDHTKDPNTGSKPVVFYVLFRVFVGEGASSATHKTSISDLSRILREPRATVRVKSDTLCTSEIFTTVQLCMAVLPITATAAAAREPAMWRE